jgi:hypothetical protein
MLILIGHPRFIANPRDVGFRSYREVKVIPLLSGGFIEYKSVINVLLLKVDTIVLNHPT